MAFIPTSQLKSDPQIYLRDQQHAARLFVDDQFKFLPKNRFSFHVSFSINSAAPIDKSLIQKYRNEINMLVKSADLPGFEITTEVLNQYNRQKVVQNRHKTKDITIKFHDDNYSVINKLWKNYYNYYYADTATAETGKGYDRTAMRNFSFVKGTYGYKGNITPFFNHITIYQMARHEYVGYKLINPIITSWSHNKVAYDSKDPNDFDMKISYESVAYSYGDVAAGTPEGFGMAHYDQTPSPLTSGSTLSSVANVATSNNTIVATQQVNSYQNVQSSSTTLTSLLGTATQGVSGVQGVVFPGTTPTSTITTASLVKL